MKYNKTLIFRFLLNTNIITKGKRKGGLSQFITKRYELKLMFTRPKTIIKLHSFHANELNILLLQH
jgi:hypothetical protein